MTPVPTFRAVPPSSKLPGPQEEGGQGSEKQPSWVLMSSRLASDQFGFPSWLWPSVILGQLSSLLGLSFPSPIQTGCSGCQVWGLLGEQLPFQESSLRPGCVWARTAGMGRAGCWGGGAAYQFTAPSPKGDAARIHPPLRALLLLASERIWM